MKNSLKTSEQKICDHCFLPIPPGVSIENQGRRFCCQACQLVYGFLQTNGLENYYSFKNNLSDFAAQQPKYLENFHWQEQSYVDDPEWQKDYLQINGQHRTIKFYVEGMHCMACLWLLEKLPQLDEKILEARVNFFNKSLTVTINKDAKFLEVLKLVSQMGYLLHPVKNEFELSAKRKKEERKQLYRVAVAGACAGNIMLFAISLYAGADAEWGRILEWLSLVFFLPVVFYSATTLFKNAWYTLKARRFSVDLAASVALILGSAMSVYDLLQGIGEALYFDSLSMFVFLFLSAKYILLRIQSKAWQMNSLDAQGQGALQIEKFIENDAQTILSRVESLKRGDLICLRKGSVLPVDATVLEGKSYFNFAIISGESLPVEVQEGQLIKSGARNIENDLLLRVEETYQDSYMNKLLSQVENSWLKESNVIGLTERIAFVLLNLLLLIAASVFVYFSYVGLSQEAFQRSLAILIVACPCALGIGTPLTLSFALQSLSRRGVVLKSSDSLLKIANLKNVFFDKTGTLTQGNLELVRWKGEQSEELLNIVYSLEQRSQHPIALSFVRYVKSRINPRALYLEEYRETEGVGVQAKIDAQLWSLEKIIGNENLREHQSAVQLRKNNQSIATMYFEDQLKEDAHELVELFKNHEIQTFLLSGDRQSVATYYAAQLGLEHCYADLLPEEKAQIIQQSKNSLMIGDGLNDTVALNKADVGLAVNGSIGVNLRSADVVLLDNSLKKIEELFLLSKGSVSLIKRNILFSVFYNVLGVSLAALGYLNPLAAAIFMPLSSLTILFSIVHFFKVRTNQAKALEQRKVLINIQGVNS